MSFWLAWVVKHCVRFLGFLPIRRSFCWQKMHRSGSFVGMAERLPLTLESTSLLVDGCSWLSLLTKSLLIRVLLVAYSSDSARDGRPTPQLDHHPNVL